MMYIHKCELHDSTLSHKAYSILHTEPATFVLTSKFKALFKLFCL